MNTFNYRILMNMHMILLGFHVFLSLLFLIISIIYAYKYKRFELFLFVISVLLIGGSTTEMFSWEPPIMDPKVLWHYILIDLGLIGFLIGILCSQRRINRLMK